MNSLYPEAPNALHERLQDIFNKIDDLKDSDRHMLTALLHTVSQKHPEVIEASDLIKKGMIDSENAFDYTLS